VITAKGLSVTPLSTFYRKSAGLPPVLGHFSDGSVGHETSDTKATSGRFPCDPRQSRRREANFVLVAGIGAALGPQPAIAHLACRDAALDLRWKLLSLRGIGENHTCFGLYANWVQVASVGPKMTPKAGLRRARSRT